MVRPEYAVSELTVAGAEYVFWGCALVIAYTYVGYPLLLFVAYAVSQLQRDCQYLTSRRNRRTLALLPDALPSVSLIVPVLDDQARLPGKIANIRELDYPCEKLQVIFLSNSSTDPTNDMLGAVNELSAQALVLPARCRESTALNRAVKRARNNILIFCDASTLLARDAVKNLARHFSDPGVGVVCGALGFKGGPQSEQTAGAWRKYESVLRLMEARLGATLTANAAIYALRRECYRPLPTDTLIEDFVVPMNARKLGYRVLYDPEAVAIDSAAPSVAGEFTRRVDAAVESCRALGELVGVPWSGFSLLAFFSHKMLRWVSPFLLVGFLVSNGLLLNQPVYRAVFMGQLSFYLWAGLGFVFRARLQRVGYASLGYFWLATTVAFLVGFVRFLGREEGTWHRVSQP